jgi:hypothetical protein
MRITCLFLSTFSLAVFAGDPPILPAPELVEGIPFSISTTAEWQGRIATPGFPASAREAYGQSLRAILQIHAAEAGGNHLLFQPSEKVAEAKHRSLHIVFTDQPKVLLRATDGAAMDVAVDRGMPVSGLAMSRFGVYGQQIFLVVWMQNCLLHLPQYNPRAHGTLLTWMNLAVQLNGYIDHHLAKPILVFMTDTTGSTMKGAKEQGIAAGQEFAHWLRNWKGLDSSPDEREWVITATGTTHGQFQSKSDACPDRTARLGRQGESN